MSGFSGTRSRGSLKNAWLIFQVRVKVMSLVTGRRGPVQNLPSATGRLGALLALYLHLHSGVCSVAHPSSWPGVVPDVCTICGPGIIAWFAFWPCVLSTKLYLLLLRWRGACDRSSSEARELVGAAGLKRRDAQLQLHSPRRCCAVSWQVNPNNSLLSVGIA